ncbi:MAG: hypothetical protein NT125_07750, partial [Candidatus Bipolaricaulota bacterium]|nr:hypothetical protein [Candidatus Bipolaricaulota bacterium]
SQQSLCIAASSRAHRLHGRRFERCVRLHLASRTGGRQMRQSGFAETEIVSGVKHVELSVPVREVELRQGMGSSPLRPPLTNDRREEESGTGTPDVTIPRTVKMTFSVRF